MVEIIKSQQKINYSKVYSPSKLKLFFQCSLQYYFSYIDPIKTKIKTKLKQMPENTYSFHTVGKAVHNAITLFYYLPPSERNEKNLLKKLTETWRSEAKWNKKPPLLKWGGFKTYEEERELYSESIRMLRNFLKIADENPVIYYLPAKDFRHSIKDYQNLIVPLNKNYDISGKFDLIIKENGALHIIDFKTTKKEETDPFQLDFYQLLAELNFNKPVKKTSFFFLKSGKKKSFTVRKKNKEIKEEILEKIEKIQKTKDWQPEPSPLCRYCLFVDFCPEKKKVRELTNKLNEEELYSDDLPF